MRQKPIAPGALDPQTELRISQLMGRRAENIQGLRDLSLLRPKLCASARAGDEMALQAAFSLVHLLAR